MDAFDGLVHVHLHELEHQGKSSGRLVTRQDCDATVLEDLDELDDVGVRGELFQGLDFAEVVDLGMTMHRPAYLLQGIEMILHALDRDVAATLDALRLQHLTERPLPLLADQLVLYATLPLC